MESTSDVKLCTIPDKEHLSVLSKSKLKEPVLELWSKGFITGYKRCS